MARSTTTIQVAARPSSNGRVLEVGLAVGKRHICYGPTLPAR